MTLQEIINFGSPYIKYPGKLIYRREWDTNRKHMAIKLSLTSASLLYVPENKDEKIEIFDSEYKFTLYEIMCDDWEFYND